MVFPITTPGNAHGTVDVEGVCTCAASHSGDRCEVPVGGEEGGGEGAAEGTYDGAFVLLGSFDTALAYDGMAGTAELVIDASGIRTSLQVTAADADLASVTFKAHLHAAPCSADGGGHYQDPGNPGVVRFQAQQCISVFDRVPSPILLALQCTACSGR